MAPLSPSLLVIILNVYTGNLSTSYSSVVLAWGWSLQGFPHPLWNVYCRLYGTASDIPRRDNLIANSLYEVKNSEKFNIFTKWIPTTESDETHSTLKVTWSLKIKDDGSNSEWWEPKRSLRQKALGQRLLTASCKENHPALWEDTAKSGRVVHVNNPSTWEAEAGGLP